MFFVLGVLTLTFALVIFYWLFNRKEPKAGIKNIDYYYIGTLILTLTGILFIGVSFLLRNLIVSWLLIILAGMASILSFITIFLTGRKKGSCL
jgi:hypothetical protein